MAMKDEIERFNHNQNAPIYAKETIYPEGSIVKRKVSALSRSGTGLIFDFAMVWFFDGSVVNYHWNPVLNKDRDQESMWSQLTNDGGYELV